MMRWPSESIYALDANISGFTVSVLTNVTCIHVNLGICVLTMLQFLLSFYHYPVLSVL